LSELNEDIKHEFKSISWPYLNEKQKFDLTRCMVDKSIYSESKITYYINVKDISYLQNFKAENYHNTIKQSFSDKMYLSNDKQYLIIEKEIFINDRISTNKYKAKGRNILQKSENASELIRALSYGWKYRKLYDAGVTIDKIKSYEHTRERIVYKYLNLSYLSPNIIRNILDSNIPHSINLQTLFDISGEVNFSRQEKFFYS
jgi:hypothetical protein